MSEERGKSGILATQRGADVKKNKIVELKQAITELSPAECTDLIGELEKLKGEAWLMMMRSQSERATPTVIEKERYLSVKEVAERFHVKEDWLYRHKKQLPHSQPSRKVLLFPERAIAKWFASRN